MAANFPDSPSVNDTFSVGTRNYYYDGAQWVLANTSVAASSAFNKANLANQLANGAFLQANVANTLTVANTLSNGFVIIRSSQRSKLNFIPASANVRINVDDDSAGDRINVTIEAISGGGGGSGTGMNVTAGNTLANGFYFTRTTPLANIDFIDDSLVTWNVDVDSTNFRINVHAISSRAPFDTANVANARGNLAQMASNAAFGVANLALPAAGGTITGDLKVDGLIRGNMVANVINILSQGVGSNTGYLRVNTGNVHFYSTPAIETWTLWANSSIAHPNAVVINVKASSFSSEGHFLSIVDDGSRIFRVSKGTAGDTIAAVLGPQAGSGARFQIATLGEAFGRINFGINGTDGVPGLGFGDGTNARDIGLERLSSGNIRVTDYTNNHNYANLIASNITAQNTITGLEGRFTNRLLAGTLNVQPSLVALFTHANAAMVQANTSNNMAVGNTIQSNSYFTVRGNRTRLNFLEGSGVTINVDEDVTGDRINVTIAKAAGGGMAQLSDDTDPELGGDLDAQNFSITNINVLQSNNLTIRQARTVADNVAIDITADWANTAQTFTLIRANVANDVNAGSNAAFIDLQANGSSQFKLLTNGRMMIGNTGVAIYPELGSATLQLFTGDSGFVHIGQASGFRHFTFDTATAPIFATRPGGIIAWATNNDSAGGRDLSIGRDSAGNLSIGDSSGHFANLLASNITAGNTVIANDIRVGNTNYSNLIMDPAGSHNYLYLGTDPQLINWNTGRPIYLSTTGGLVTIHDGTTPAIGFATSGTTNPDTRLFRANAGNLVVGGSDANRANLLASNIYASNTVSGIDGRFDRVIAGAMNVEPAIVASFAVANNANVYANLAFRAANAVYDFANTMNINVAATMLVANNANVYANLAFRAANAAFDKANSANLLAQTATIMMIIDGGGTALTGGEKGSLIIPFNCRIDQWTLHADQSDTVKIDIWSSVYSTTVFPTAANTLTGNVYMSLSSARANQSTVMTNWNSTTFNGGNVISYNVIASAALTLQRITVALKVTKT